MVFTSVVTKNADGSYTSSGGHEVTADASGRLWVSGAPTGLRDTGYGGIGLDSPAWAPNLGAGGAGGAGGSANAARPMVMGGGPGFNEALDDLFHRATLIYPWILAVGAFAFSVVSSVTVFGRPALHAHAGFGVAAFFFAIWAYRELMTRRATAMALALVSSLALAACTAAFFDLRAERTLGILWRNVGKGTLTVERTLAFLQPIVFMPWFFGALAVGLGLHFLYWQHRVQMARKHGWLLTSPLRDTALNAFWLLVAAGMVGGVMSFWR